MPLTLTIRNAEGLDNGSPASLILDNRGAIIGRAQTTDWCLPDPSLHISSRHCEIQYRDGGYILIDISTNGTFLQGQGARLPGPHIIQPGDVFLIGHYEMVAALDGQTAASMAARNAAPPPPQWKGWQSDSPGAAAPASVSNWDAVPTGSAISGTGPMSQSWAPPSVESAPPAAASGWGAPDPAASSWTAAPPPPPPASGWSSAIPDQAAAPTADDVWGKFNDSNVVDWARGGFGTPAATPPAGFSASPTTPSADASLGLAQTPAFGSMPHQAVPQATPAATPPPPPPAQAVPQPMASVAPPAPAAAGQSVALLLAALGLSPDHLKQSEAETLTQAGDILRRVVAGLVVMLEARARAKSQMGAQGTSLEFDGNNPLKFARTPEQALAQMLNPPERGFMAADRAVEDAFRDLQAHQMATLKAMQGALRATLDRFSPTAIRSRATQTGLMAKILPGARDAALWQAYEKEFSGVARGSDEAFMDVFAKEFRKAYEEAAKSR